MPIIQVSNRTINLDGRVYNLRTVSSVGKKHGKTPYPFRAKVIGYTFLAFLVAVFFANAADTRTGGIWASAAIGTFLAFTIYKNIKPRDFWVLQLEVAGAYSSLLASRDEHSIDRAITQICAALESDVPFQSTVNISDSTIVSDSKIGDGTYIGR